MVTLWSSLERKKKLQQLLKLIILSNQEATSNDDEIIIEMISLQQEAQCNEVRPTISSQYIALTH